MRALRGGLFGCGMISEFHLRAWRRIPEVEIVALGNRTVERAEERRAEFAPNAHVYADLGEMLAREARDHGPLDFVDILTPPALHREHCLAAAAAGAHVICQKPLSGTLDDARDLVARMRGRPTLFAVHENHRYRPWFRRVVRLHRAGFFGPPGAPLVVRLEHLAPSAPAEAYKLQTERGVLLEYGTHLVDMVRALLGEPARVYARLHRAHPGVRGENVAHVAFEYAGATAVVDVGWKAAGVLQGGALVHGPDGEAYFEGSMTRDARSRFRLARGGEVVADETRSPYDDYVESFYLFERACVDAMLSGGGVEQTGEENLRTLELTFAAYEAAERGAVVDLGVPA